jgi:hypothetical protein
VGLVRAEDVMRRAWHVQPEVPCPYLPPWPLGAYRRGGGWGVDKPLQDLAHEKLAPLEWNDTALWLRVDAPTSG